MNNAEIAQIPLEYARSAVRGMMRTTFTTQEIDDAIVALEKAAIAHDDARHADALGASMPPLIREGTTLYVGPMDQLQIQLFRSKLASAADGTPIETHPAGDDYRGGGG